MGSSGMGPWGQAISLPANSVYVMWRNLIDT
eukprot:CAMPEP_0174366558 /NCGR_PEP_ID=MMETSP0811_2-20130205/81681_1 /TAXON_ID=73025 ORGANISM="Eutreptiella gymnastica-like, Strain CCMP1594" /NCGR_SAMPLE_ID=MMETSP0811_2 /ASSEMBLY_ACC=CAM_ASM_000667 /LENGTH=30 /DNA_ID= /DNA_START= /DNA_END= /DNA_ORIENTATION=